MSLKFNTEEFKARVKEKYGDRFDTTDTVYKGSYFKVSLRCVKHDLAFECDPVALLRIDSMGNFCPECNHSKKLSHAKHLEHEEPEVHLDYTNMYQAHKVLGEEECTFYKTLMLHLPTGLKVLKLGTDVPIIPSNFQVEVVEEVLTTKLQASMLEQEYSKANTSQRLRIDNRTYYLPTELQLLKSAQLSALKTLLLQNQGGICAICKKVPKIPVVDHWHQKRNNGDGCVRSVICSTCNIMVAVVENNLIRNCIDYSDATAWLRSLADYLEVDTKNLVHPTEKPVVKINKTQFKALMKKYLEKYPNKKELKYPVGGKANAKLQELIKELND